MRRYKKYRRTKKSYSLSHLLEKQPAGLKKHKLYGSMMSYLRQSRSLQNLRFGRTCYSLLNRVRVAPEKLAAFYRAYHLPQSPFFPLFLAIKRDYLDRRREVKRARKAYIITTMRSLDPRVLGTLKALAAYEKSAHLRGGYPLGKGHLFPRSKKGVNRLLSYSLSEWVTLFVSHLERLRAAYAKLDHHYGKKIIALFILNLPPGTHSPEVITRQFRLLSKQYHPDAGGEPRLFRYLHWGREVLLAPERVGG